MKHLILLCLILFTSAGQAQLNTQQDRPELYWQEIESDHFKVVYPSHLRHKAQYVLNLLEFYRHEVSAPYKVDTRKYTVIIRSEMANPNGFVTLMPRRSEWYSASAITPTVSALEWYQVLAVHEYRHMVQFDYLKRPRVQWGYWLFGDLGGAALMGAVAPPWYFEGDGVYAETVLSNAGRGRSPRFSARMKSLLTNDGIPAYDEFIGGVYTTILPNHYVYGYFLSTAAYKKYGEDVWKKILANAARSPLNLYTLYNAFEEETGDDFIDFYYQVMREIKQEWGTLKQPSNDLYTRYDYPLLDQGKLYFLKWDLDSFWTLYQSEGKKAQKIKELNISPSLSKTDIKRGKFAYAQITPDNRYGYRSFSDIYLLDVKTKAQKRITREVRAYHPSIHPAKDEIMAVEFVDSLKVGLSFFDFEGNRNERIILEDFNFAEAVWTDSGEILALLLDEQGMKFIAKINRQSGKASIIKKAGRNNVYALRPYQGAVYFESDDNGAVNAFSLDLSSGAVSRCASERIAAYRPFPAGGKLVYVAEIGNGQRIKSAAIKNCEKVPSNFLSSFEGYLGDTPSDNFHETKPKTIKDFGKLYESKWSAQDFFELEEGFTPNSWSFIGGRGFQLQGSANNFLNTFSIDATLGEDSLESRPFANLSLSYRKFYPILSLNLGYQERSADEDGDWSEARAGLGVTLPYVFRKNLYRGLHTLSFFGDNIEVSNRESPAPYKIDDDQVFSKTVVFSTSLTKDIRFRELRPNWGYDLNFEYTDAQANENPDFSSYLGYGRLDLYAPGFAPNHGSLLALSGEYRNDDVFSYRIESPANFVNEYAWSRGYEFEYAQRWEKASLNYIMPLSYPNRAWGRWIYFNRIYTNLFVDYTKFMDLKERSLNSAGAEFFFETLTFRKLPLTYGLRYINKLSDEESVAEGFFQVNIAI